MVMVYGLVIGTICIHYRLRKQRILEEGVQASSVATANEGKAGESKRDGPEAAGSSVSFVLILHTLTTKVSQLLHLTFVFGGKACLC